MLGRVAAIIGQLPAAEADRLADQFELLAAAAEHRAEPSAEAVYTIGRILAELAEAEQLQAEPSAEHLGPFVRFLAELDAAAE